MAKSIYNLPVIIDVDEKNIDVKTALNHGEIPIGCILLGKAWFEVENMYYEIWLQPRHEGHQSQRVLNTEQFTLWRIR